MAVSIITRDNERAWRASDGDMWDEIARAVYPETGGAFEALLAANPALLELRGERLVAGDLVALPPLATPGTIKRIRLFS